MKDEMIRDMLEVVIEQYTVSEVTSRHVATLAEGMTEGQDKELKTVIRGAHADGFIDGFKYALKLATEINS